MKSDSLKKLRIFAASPSDMTNERYQLEKVVTEFKPLAEHVGITLELVDWEKVVPDPGRPEQIILDQLNPTTWDVFIGILWHRFGTPPGGTDPHTQKEYLSGTEEEFKTAYRLWKVYRKPRIMMYRCTRPFPFDVDPDQLKRVNEFFKFIENPVSEYRVLVQKFETTKALAKLFYFHLQNLLLEYDKQHWHRAIASDIPQNFEIKNPDNLPRRAPFFGRSKEMSAVMRALSPDDRTWGVLVDGIGGIGKTALAIEAAYLCKDQCLFNSFVFVSAKQKTLAPDGIHELNPAATTLHDFVNETARVLGKAGIAWIGNDALKETSSKYRAMLAALRGTQTLLIYDNLETLTKEEQEAMADFLRELPQGCKAIITSRRRGGEGALWLRLDKLEWNAACQLIQEEAKKDASLERKLTGVGTERWKELYYETKGSPLALVHILGLLRTRATLSFDGALEMLRGHRDEDLQRFVFKEARKELGPNEVAALCALAFFSPSAPFDALSETAKLTRNALEMSLDRLYALSLVDVNPQKDSLARGAERYAVHPLTRNFVYDELLTDAQTKCETGMRFAKYWVDYAERFGGAGRNYRTYSCLNDEWKNLHAAAEWLWNKAAIKDGRAGDNDAARWLNDLVRAVRQFLWFWGFWNERVQLCTWAYSAISSQNDWCSAGWRAYDVAWIHLFHSQIDEAAIWSNHCSDAWNRGGTRSEQAVGMRMRGLVAAQRGEYDLAECWYYKALEIWRSVKNDEWLALGLDSLGELETKRQNYDIAERYYYESLALAEKMDNLELQANISGNLGELALDRCFYPEARKWFEKELPLAREIGRQSLIARAQYGLARIEEAEGNAELALPLAQEALTIYERLQHKDLVRARDLMERLATALNKNQN